MSRLDHRTLEEGKELLRDLIRLDTTNPPGNEAIAVDLLEGILRKEGISFERIEPEPGRANLVARIPGDGSEEPILLSSHLDVVPAGDQEWTHPPFSAAEADGCIWGRGAIDMKGFAAMAFTVLRWLQRQDRPLRRDVIVAAVADEETGCRLGSTYLVDHHPDLVRAEIAINEVGGFNVDIQGKHVYLIQRAERGVAWLRLRLRGKAGHSSLPAPDSCLGEAGRILNALSRSRFPHHPNPPALEFLDQIARHSNFVEALVLKGFRSPWLGKQLLHSVFPTGEKRLSTQANFSNTVTPTVLRAGKTVNAVPSGATLDLDGRIVPGSSLEELIQELRQIIGPDPELEVLAHHDPVVFPTDHPFYKELEAVLRDHDPEAEVAPYLISGFTDSWNWARLGTQCYGFYPLKLPEDLRFADLFHGVDERIPVEGFRFGLECLLDLLDRVALKG